MNGGNEQCRAAQFSALGVLSMSSERTEAVHTICLTGELDLATSDGVDAELKRVEASDAPMIVLDLCGLTFMSSSGVQLLIDAELRSRDSQRLALLRGPPAVQRLLELCGVHTALPFATRPGPSRDGRSAAQTLSSRQAR